MLEKFENIYLHILTTYKRKNQNKKKAMGSWLKHFKPVNICYGLKSRFSTLYTYKEHQHFGWF